LTRLEEDQTLSEIRSQSFDGENSSGNKPLAGFEARTGSEGFEPPPRRSGRLKELCQEEKDLPGAPYFSSPVPGRKGPLPEFNLELSDIKAGKKSHKSG
jgi:hypothetical protein